VIRHSTSILSSRRSLLVALERGDQRFYTRVTADRVRKMTTFEIPTISTERLRLRAFQASDLDAYAAMQANPEVMRFLVDGRTHTRVEVWRIMTGSLGSWPLRGYGMWACVKADTSRFVGASESSSRSTGRSQSSPTH
jgi:RimJ/RimL family protein N-acetyltransferase